MFGRIGIGLRLSRFIPSAKALSNFFLLKNGGDFIIKDDGSKIIIRTTN